MNSIERPSSHFLDAILGRRFEVLDHGFVRVLDYMGGDTEVAEAARVSYGRGTKTSRDNRNLIRYLMKHKHTSPFEMAEIKLHLKAPIFVARQWMRHRMASINEASGRYSIFEKEFYVPKITDICEQSTDNKQGRGQQVSLDYAGIVMDMLRQDSERQYESYEFLLNDRGDGEPVDETREQLARELARMSLTMNYYIEWYWKIDLHNLLHFLQLRLDPHAQLEIRKYAERIGQIVKNWVPDCWDAFLNYRLEAVTFSRIEMKILRQLVKAGAQWLDGPTLLYAEAEEPIGMHVTVEEMESMGLSGRERKELLKRFE